MFDDHVKPTRKVGFVLGLIFALIGLLLIVGAWGAYITDSRIQNDGLSAQGYIEKKQFLAVADGESDYILQYQFITGKGTPVESSRTVSKTLWDKLHEGQTIEIKYADNNPKRNFPLGAGVTSLGVTLFISSLGTIFAMLSGGLIWAYFHAAAT